ncbi:MAG: HAMP domain-containing histidine kinase [Propionibacteriaceae bacterium]|jgi:signal transduction histidine kinase|nr:HAMP domain-containing histidine kinase [Propionibacteriaceae bacterium]
MLSFPGRFSFRFRLLTAIAALAVLGLVGAGSLSYLVERARTDARIDASLGRSVEELRKYSGVDSTTGVPLSFRSTRELVYGAVHQSVNAQDECTLGIVGDLVPWAQAGGDEICTRVAGDAVLVEAFRAATVADAAQLRHLDTATGRYAFVAVPVTLVGDLQSGVYVVVIDRGSELEVVAESYLRGYGIVALASVLLIVVVGWVLAGQILRPLGQLVKTTRQITASDLTQRVPVTGSDEVAELASSMNSMLDSVENAVVSERRLLDDVGHELRTPLTIIRGHLELTDPNDPADFTDTKALALDEIDRMHRLVNSLVTLAQADSPDFVRLEPVALAPLLDEVLDKARALGDRKWRLDVPDEVTVLADPQRLTQALLELISNAVKYSEPKTAISLGLSRQGDQVEITVRDAGQGIPEAVLPHVFERFTRAAGAERVDGSGLGLPIADKIVQAHRGQITIESTVGQGSTFIITLPVADQVSPVSPPSSATEVPEPPQEVTR